MGFDALKAIDDVIKMILSYLDQAFKEGWVWYILIGLGVLFFVMVLFNRSSLIG